VECLSFGVGASALAQGSCVLVQVHEFGEALEVVRWYNNHHKDSSLEEHHTRRVGEDHKGPKRYMDALGAASDLQEDCALVALVANILLEAVSRRMAVEVPYIASAGVEDAHKDP
jgi:hypothetical protein